MPVDRRLVLGVLVVRGGQRHAGLVGSLLGGLAAVPGLRAGRPLELVRVTVLPADGRRLERAGEPRAAAPPPAVEHAS